MRVRMRSEETGVPVLALPPLVQSWERSDITKKISKEHSHFEVLVLLLSDQITLFEMTEERTNRKSLQDFYKYAHCGL